MKRIVTSAALGAAAVFGLWACSSDDGSAAGPSGADGTGADGGPGPEGAAGPGPQVDAAVAPATFPTAAWMHETANFNGSVHDVAVSGVEAYVTGSWASKKSPFDATQTNPGTGVDRDVAWLAKIDGTGKLAWARSFPKTPYNGGGFQKVVANADGSTYVLGLARVPLDLETATVTKGTFIAKFDPSGNAVWAHTLADGAGSGDSFAAFDMAGDDSGVWLAATVKGTGTIDGASVALVNSSVVHELALVRFAANGTYSAAESFVATKGGVSRPTVAVRTNGDLVIAGLTGDSLTIGDTALGQSGGLFWALIPKGTRDASWFGLQQHQLGARLIGFGTTGPGAIALEYDKTPTLAGKTFPAGEGIALEGISEADGTVKWALPYVPTKPNARIGPKVQSVATSANGVAMIGDASLFDIDFGGGVIAKSGFLLWASPDGTPLHSAAIPEKSRAAFDKDGNLLVAGIASHDTIGGKEVSGFYLVKLLK